MRVEFHPAAAKELIETSAFYDEKAPGLGERFVAEVERAVRLLLKRPSIGQKAGKGRPRIVLAGFPYSLIYSAKPNGVWIVAVVHHRRRPGYWRGRREH